MGEVARFKSLQFACEIGDTVVVQSSRGEEWGVVVRPDASAETSTDERPPVLRIATSDDQQRLTELRQQCEHEFPVWQQRIRDWRVDVELIDLERTLDGEKLVLYVLNDRGPETTKLALQAAAAGFGVIEVQPVGREGLIVASGGGGCGNCGHKK
jgi:cell fate regulator YaaT (PSP1 superfamily)